MSTETLLAKALELSAAEEMSLVEDIWDSVGAEPDHLPLSDELKAELDGGLAELRQGAQSLRDTLQPGRDGDEHDRPPPAERIANDDHLVP